MSSDEKLFYASSNGNRDTRSSHFYRSEKNATDVVADQNARAVAMGIKARYQLTETTGEGIEGKNIRD